LRSARPFDGCDGSVRPAASRLAKWAGTGRKRFLANTRIWVLERIKAGDFTLRGLAAELAPKAALDLPLFRRGALGPLGNAVPLAHTFRREQVLYQRANSGEDSTADERGDDLTDDGTQ
jgi:hypothetical protein